MNTVIKELKDISSSNSLNIDAYTVIDAGESSPVLIVMRGYPGSGKTTISRNWVSNSVHRILVSRDLIRESMILTEGRGIQADHQEETMIDSIVNNTISQALQNNHSVILDQTSLPRRYVKKACQLGLKNNATVIVVTMLTDFDTCLKRVKERKNNGGRYIPEDVLREKYDRFGDLTSQKKIEVNELADKNEFTPYRCHHPEMNPAILFDIDGTLATMQTGENQRSPYDWHRVHEDDVNDPVLRQLNANIDAGYTIIIMSGRSDESREKTEKWLRDNDIRYDALFMRKAGDTRKDPIIKRELLEIVEKNYGEVVGIFDDRNQVVDMYRSIGLPVFQVDYGDF